jgi:acetyl-CoA acetyltransferase
MHKKDSAGKVAVLGPLCWLYAVPWVEQCRQHANGMVAWISKPHLSRFTIVFCRQCSSGLQAIASVAAAIKSGYYSIGLAGGVETMSANPMAWEGGINPRVEHFPKAQGCLMPMGVTSENVAAAFGVSR